MKTSNLINVCICLSLMTIASHGAAAQSSTSSPLYACGTGSIKRITHQRQSDGAALYITMSQMPDAEKFTRTDPSTGKNAIKIVQSGSGDPAQPSRYFEYLQTTLSAAYLSGGYIAVYAANSTSPSACANSESGFIVSVTSN